MNKEITTISADELRQMSDADLLAHLRRYPFRSQWTSASAWQHAEYRLALLNGKRYAQTGNLSAFKNSMR